MGLEPRSCSLAQSMHLVIVLKMSEGQMSGENIWKPNVLKQNVLGKMSGCQLFAQLMSRGQISNVLCRDVYRDKCWNVPYMFHVYSTKLIHIQYILFVHDLWRGHENEGDPYNVNEYVSLLACNRYPKRPIIQALFCLDMLPNRSAKILGCQAALLEKSSIHIALQNKLSILI